MSGFGEIDPREPIAWRPLYIGARASMGDGTVVETTFPEPVELVTGARVFFGTDHVAVYGPDDSLLGRAEWDWRCFGGCRLDLIPYSPTDSRSEAP